VAVLAHIEGIDFFSPAELDQLDTVVALADRAPIGSWDDPRADALLADAEVIIGHWLCPRLDAAVLERAPNLGLVAYAAGTVKDVVTDAVFDRGIRVTSGAKANAEPVAQFTLAAVIFATKDVFWRRDELRDRSIRDTRQPGDVPVGALHKTIGIVGASAVGRRTIELLQAVGGFELVVFDPYLTDDEATALGVTKVDLDELCGRVDVLSIHAPELPSTRHLVGAAQLARLRTGATVINTARGSIVDQDALVAELATGRLTAVIDVTDPEHLPADHPLRTLPNVFLTPHLAGSEGTELARLTDHVVEEIRRWVAGEPALNQIHREQLPRLA
jgi:phosphoglycerate dehydrogenase-like enzyme